MTINDVLVFAKENDVAVTAIKCNPSYSDKKNRVTKGDTIPHKDWNKKKRWELKNTKTIHNQPAKAWMIDLSKIGVYVIDIDTIGGKKPKDVLHESLWNHLYDECQYIVETGSGGIHAYFKKPISHQNVPIKKSIANSHFKQWFINEDDGDVDIIVDAIVTEGSTYEHEGTIYSYTCLKGDIFSIAECDPMWSEVEKVSCIPTTRESTKSVVDYMEQPVEYQEIIDHIHNIPNHTRNWQKWYEMAQLIYNIIGSTNGLDIFLQWSSQIKDHDHKVAITLWKGLSERHSGSVLTIGTLLYRSKLQNQENYNRIRAKYHPLSYRSMKYLMEEDHFFVEEPTPYWVRIRDRDIVTYSEHDFRLILKPLLCPSIDKRGNEKMTPFYDLWSMDKNRRMYKRFGFYPDPTKCPKEEYNTFIPAEASFEDVHVDDIDLSPILTHFDIMGNHEVDNVEFLLNFFAQIVQQPDVLPGIAIILYGKEGAGKDILVDWIGNDVLGYQQYRKVGDVANLFKNFNSHVVGKLLMHSDEIDNKTMKENIEKLKRFLTSTRIDIEKKGKDVVAFDNFCRLLMTTNNRDAMMGLITFYERRIVLMESSSEKIHDRNYFTQLHTFLKTSGVARAFYDYLMKRDISSFHHTNRPQTKLYREMKQASIHPILKWIADADEMEGEIEQKTTQWMASYNLWAEQNNMKRYNVTSFGLFVSEYTEKDMGITKHVTKTGKHIIINGEKVRKWLDDLQLLD